MFGPAVVAALRDAFIVYWRHWSPKLRSERPAGMRNTISTLDCIGIVGVTLEAAGRSTWAIELSHDDAVRAAIYATLELNGFPAWFETLAKAQPSATREVLARAIAPELIVGATSDCCEELEDISRSPVTISSLIANQLFDYLSSNESLRASILAPLLRILRAGYGDKDRLVSLLRLRLGRAMVADEEPIFFASLFQLNPDDAIAALEAKLSTLDSNQQTLLVQAVLSRLYGWPWEKMSLRLSDLPFQSLERLVVIAYRTIRVEEDKDHSDGRVYSPDARDNAESVRSALFQALIATPGRATFEAIHRLMDIRDFPIKRKRMLDIARKRAASDSEHEVWTSGDVCAFVSDFLKVPRTPIDLQRLALRNIADLQYDLLNADYAQGATVASLPKEVDVQNWLADRLRTHQDRNYSIEREPHVVEEKEPDIRFRAKASDANVPMEIKVAESWSLTQLEDALTEQLIGRYLRNRNNRHGILLLVHQHPRATGWRTQQGDYLSFKQVFGHLQSLARSISAEYPNAPQAEIAAIDVSTSALCKAFHKAERRASRTGARKYGLSDTIQTSASGEDMKVHFLVQVAQA